MNKDEILAKSRKENESGDEMAKQAQLRAASISRAVGFFLCVLGALLDSLLLENGLVGLTCWMVYWGMQAVEGWVLMICTKSKNGWRTATVKTLLFVLFAVALIVRMLDFV
jgi:hypothetical protein